jgi:hypothetical protein
METKFYSKKSALRFFYFLALVLGFASTNVNAQCHAITTDEDGNITNTIVIPCDFPVLLSTSDVTTGIDAENYAIEYSNWTAANPDSPLPTPARGYVEITQAAFNLMAIERKTAIEALPSYFHVIE